MKTDAQVDEIMRRIPERHRYWCESDNCFCAGCVQNANHVVIEEIRSGDPLFSSHEYDIEEMCKALTKDEWLAWCARQAALEKAK